MTQLPTQTNRKVSSFSKLELAYWNYLCRLQTRQQAQSLQTGKECEYEELRFRRGSPLACRVMGITCSSLQKQVPGDPMLSVNLRLDYFSFCSFPMSVSKDKIIEASI